MLFFKKIKLEIEELQYKKEQLEKDVLFLETRITEGNEILQSMKFYDKEKRLLELQNVEKFVSEISGEMFHMYEWDILYKGTISAKKFLKAFDKVYKKITDDRKKLLIQLNVAHETIINMKKNGYK